MPNNLDQVGIITINWNGYDDTVACVRSLLALKYEAFHVYIVDNQSVNNEADNLRDIFLHDRRVTVIHNARNDGYAGGNNVGFQRARADGWADFLWLVNNDATVDPLALTELVSVAKVAANIGVVGSTILYSDRKYIYALGGGQINMWTGIDRLFSARQPWPSSYRPTRFDYVSGASFFITAPALDILRGFDADYFLYSEEADLCLRAKKAGLALAYAPQSIVYHQSAKSTGHLSPTYIYYFLRNKFLLMHKQTPWWHWPTWILSTFFYYGLGFYFLLLRRGRVKTLTFVNQALSDGLRFRGGTRKAKI